MLPSYDKEATGIPDPGPGVPDAGAGVTDPVRVPVRAFRVQGLGFRVFQCPRGVLRTRKAILWTSQT